MPKVDAKGDRGWGRLAPCRGRGIRPGKGSCVRSRKTGPRACRRRRRRPGEPQRKEAPVREVSRCRGARRLFAGYCQMLIVASVRIRWSPTSSSAFSASRAAMASTMLLSSLWVCCLTGRGVGRVGVAAVEADGAAVLEDRGHDLDEEAVLRRREHGAVEGIDRFLEVLPGRRGKNVGEQAPHLGDFGLPHPGDDQVHHRRFEQQPSLDDLDEARHRVVRRRRRSGPCGRRFRRRPRSERCRSRPGAGPGPGVPSSPAPSARRCGWSSAAPRGRARWAACRPAPSARRG